MRLGFACARFKVVKTRLQVGKMSELFDDEEGNAPALSVSELSGAVKRVVEGEFGRVRVRGEVGRVSRPSSGHLYLDLKDDRAVLASVVWKGVASRLAHQPEAGMEVIVTGRLTTFPGQSRYQLVIESLAPAGVGALMAMLEKRKATLAAEGLFAAEHKSALPYLPEVIGVVTSPSGAVIRDILHRLRARFPRKVLVWPAVVQGDKCAEEVAKAIDGFNNFTSGGALPRPDVLIVARGGGSLEDLWGFNEEVVVRAVFNSTIPVITAVGHETDTTLVDYASDKRAPTPTAAAEMAVPVRADLLASLAALEARRVQGMVRKLETGGQRLRDLSRALPRGDAILAEKRQRLDGVAMRLPRALMGFVQQKQLHLSRYPLRPAVLKQDVQFKRHNLENWGGRLSRAGESQLKVWRQSLSSLDRTRRTLGYENTLKRGYAVVRGDGAVVVDVAGAKAAKGLEIQFSDGRVEVGPSGAGKPKPATKRPKQDGGQGSLF